MNKRFVICAAALSVITACSSTPSSINQNDSSEVQAKINAIQLNGTLVRETNGFSIGPFLTVDRFQSTKMVSTNNWQFEGKTLFPNFKSQRFECDMSIDECSEYENIDSPFLRVSSTDSDYGDTYGERVAEGKRPGMTAGDVALTGASAVIVAPFMILATAIATPGILVNGTANLISHGSVFKNKWVEFDHDSFYEQTFSAIEVQHGSLANYIDFMSLASNAYHKLEQYNVDLLNEMKGLRENKIQTLNQYGSYDLDNIHNYSFQMPSSGNIETIITSIRTKIDSHYAESKISLLAAYDSKFTEVKKLFTQQQKKDFVEASDSHAMRKFISKYRNQDEANLIPVASQKLSSLIKEEQKLAFSSISSSDDATRFIAQYEKEGEAKLVTEAKQKWRALIIKEQKISFDKISTIRDAKQFIAQYQYNDEAKLVQNARDLISQTEKRVQKEKTEKRNATLAKLETWRKGLKVGEQTFCGRVIESKYPMFQIAITHPLQGLSDTVWLEKDKIFTPQSGCRNINNQLSPQVNPLNS